MTMTTLEIQVPEKHAKKYKLLFDALVKKKLNEEEFEDFFLWIKIDEVKSDKKIDSETFMKHLWGLL